MVSQDIAQSQAAPKMLVSILLVWVAVLIYASSNSIVSLLADIGERHPVDGRNVITFCNLLFIGSLLSLIPMVLIFRKDWTRENLSAMSRKDWAILTLSAFLSSALTPALFFYALEFSSVTNVVLVGRIEPPLFLLATVFVLREDFDVWAFAAGIIALVGAVVMISLKDSGASFQLGKGELAAAIATLSFIASTLVARTALRNIPMGIFSIYRTSLGTVIYFVIAMYLYGAHHFQDLFNPLVWKWVWVYAVIVIILGQFAWNLGLKHARSGDVALATSFSPLAGILFAMLLVGEDPGKGLIPGGALILFAIAVGQYGRWRKARQDAAEKAERDAQDMHPMEHESRVNFKGA